MKIRNQLKKVLIILAGISILSTNLIAKETVTYPKESKSIQILGFEKLENSFGISSSSEGNTIYINSGGKPLERVFGAAEDSNNKFSEIKNNHVIINGGILATILGKKWSEDSKRWKCLWWCWTKFSSK